MDLVSYDHSFDYSYDAKGQLRPLLRFVASNIADPLTAVEVETALDCGAERSLFSGMIGFALGIDVLQGEELKFRTMAGGLIPARLHPVHLTHADLGTFELEVAFSSGDMHRNLLGRDFFNLVQVGFREHHLRFFVTASP